MKRGFLIPAVCVCVCARARGEGSRSARASPAEVKKRKMRLAAENGRKSRVAKAAEACGAGSAAGRRGPLFIAESGLFTCRRRGGGQ